MAILFDLLDCGADGCLERVVGDEDECGGGAFGFLALAAALDDAFDRDFFIGQNLRDGGHGTRAVDQFKGHVVAALMGLLRRLFVRLELGGGNAEGGAPVAAGDINDVGEYRRSGWMGAGTAAFQHEIADEIALHDDGVEHAIGVGDGRSPWERGWD